VSADGVLTGRPDAKACIDEAVAQTEAICERHGLTYAKRGDPHRYLRVYTAINHGLTLWPFIVPERHVEVLLQKGLWTAWGLAIDDAVDKDASINELNDSLAALAGAPTQRTPEGAVLRKLLERAAASWGDATPLRVSLAEFMTAWLHDHACRTRPWLAETERVLRHRQVTFGLGPHLAIDAAASGGAYDDAQLRATGRVYRELGIAMRLASDLGDLDCNREEGAQNMIDVWRLNGLGDDDELCARAAQLIRKHLANARELLGDGVAVPGIVDVIETADRFTTHLSRGAFVSGARLAGA
jgi:Terpene synthase family 2, C-terminal metal binding